MSVTPSARWRPKDKALGKTVMGWCKPAAGEHVFVVTHQPPTDWEHVDAAPFTFVQGVEEVIAAAQAFAGDWFVDVGGGQIGGKASRSG